MTPISYFYPRVCPILSVSRGDLVRGIELFGREETMKTLAMLITKNYDFPYARQCNPRTPAPSVLDNPRFESRTTPAPATALLGCYRCTRLKEDQKIPGITLLLRDSLSRVDWNLDCFMERQRMQCWIAIRGKTREAREALSPYIRGTNVEILTKLLDAELTGKKNPALLDHAILRDMLLGNSEAIPPTVELYLQTIEKLHPVSVTATRVGYGVSLAAMSCIDVPCSYSSEGLTEEAKKSLREFLGDKISEKQGDADLIFVDVLPYGSHDMRGYISNGQLGYAQYIKNAVAPIIKQRPRTDPPMRIALVVSLRELPAQPTVEPILLSILATDSLDLVGALVSQKRDYAVYLMLVNKSPRKDTEQWAKILESAYPELYRTDSSPSEVSGGSLRAPAPVTWDAVCLASVLPGLLTPRPPDTSIALQGARKVQGKAVFPVRTRNCTPISETHDTETGDIVYVFPTVADPLPELPPVVSSPEIADPLISRMVSGIQRSIATESKVEH